MDRIVNNLASIATSATNPGNGSREASVHPARFDFETSPTTASRMSQFPTTQHAGPQHAGPQHAGTQHMGAQVTGTQLAGPRDARQLDALIEQELVNFEELMSDQLASEYPIVSGLFESAAALQGKRLRPRLVLLSALACGNITPNTRRVAAVVEMVHAATLVHDDVLDNADTRRGIPAAHVTWGNRASILLGDMLFSKAFILAASAGDCFAAERVGRAGQALCEGELRQQDSIGKWSLALSEYIDILRHKTGDLCAASSLLGAWSAGASESWQHALELYGSQLGIAFQIYDDWLDVWGTAALGKPTGNDVANRKPTLPTLRLLETTAAQDRASVLALLDAGQMSDTLRELLDRSDASAVTLDTARHFAQSACAALATLPDSVAKQALIAVAQQSVSRRR